MTIGAVTRGCRERLTAHYGEPVAAWLDSIPWMLTKAMERWKLRPCGYHDAGHASVLATALTSAGRSVMLKAWFDRGRFRRETAALGHWEVVNGPVVLGQDDTNAVAYLTLIGGVPGGRLRPADGDTHVASALARLHAHPPPHDGFPTLNDYLATEVESRIQRRVRQFADEVPRQQVAFGFGALQSRLATGTTVLLHGDLYRENVPFAEHGPVFLDPLPMLGDAAFDWAFFIVYHDLTGDPVARLRLASEVGDIPVNVLVPWCLTLCFDGLLYCHEVRDAREPRMADLMEVLAAVDGLPS